MEAERCLFCKARAKLPVEKWGLTFCSQDCFALFRLRLIKEADGVEPHPVKPAPLSSQLLPKPVKTLRTLRLIRSGDYRGRVLSAGWILRARKAKGGRWALEVFGAPDSEVPLGTFRFDTLTDAEEFSQKLEDRAVQKAVIRVGSHGRM